MKRIYLTALILLTIPTICFSATIHVPGDQATIQAGIDAAVNGDTVLVAPGTYVENIKFNGKRITLTSSGGAAVTVIDGNQAARVVTFSSAESSNSVLDGFTITNGAPPTGQNGGGIYCYFHSHPTIRNNIISGNGPAYWGGGIACYLYCSPDITNNTITHNAAITGGGIACTNDCHPDIMDNVISSNVASMDGGGLSCLYDSFPRIANNTISENSAGERGGGISFAGESSPKVFYNILSNNTAQYGGGILCDDSSPVIMNNMLMGNTVSGAGAGIACFDDSSPTITNVTVVTNTARLKGGGIYCVALCSPTVRNSILWDNGAAAGKEIWVGSSTHPSTITLSHSDVDGGQGSIHLERECTLNWGAAMIDADPLFVNPLENDLHLTYSSPCRNSGDNSAVTELYDFESDPRIAFGTVDMGADEFSNHLYCTGHFTPGGAIEGKFVGSPGTWPVGLFIGSAILDTPLHHKWGLFYLDAPWFFYPLVPISSYGVLVLPETIPRMPSAPYDISMQALIGWEMSNWFVLPVR